MRYRIITDSTGDLPAELVRNLQLTVIPMEFTIDGKSYRNYPDGHEMNAGAFYRLLRAGKTSTTAQINSLELVEWMEPILQAGEDLLYLAFSSGLSGTCQGALMAKKELSAKYPERKIYVVDSLAASMGEGLLAYYASKMQMDGKSIDEVYEWLQENKLHLCHWFTVDDLNHLKRGGRVSPAAALFGTMLGIKPVLHVDDAGHLIPVSKIRGRRQSLDTLVAHMEATVTNPEEQVIFISHGDCEKDAQYVADKIRSKWNVKDIVLNEIGPVIGSHSGPGTVALFFLGSKR